MDSTFLPRVMELCEEMEGRCSMPNEDNQTQAVPGMAPVGPAGPPQPGPLPVPRLSWDSQFGLPYQQVRPSPPVSTYSQGHPSQTKILGLRN
jgi:hypothetical protein